jgi:Flp pilus assembly protein TadG
MIARRSRPPRRGSTLPVVVLLMTVLVGMVSFAVDVGYVAHGRTQLQASADAGAHAALTTLYQSSTGTPDYPTARAAGRTYVQNNQGSGFAVPDADIEFANYTPTAASGSRYSTAVPKGTFPNAARVTLRQDGPTNPKLNLFFGNLLGQTDNAVQARGTVWLPYAQGIQADAELIPYIAHVDLYRAAAGLPARDAGSAGFVNFDPTTLTDSWNVGPVGATPARGTDGVKEFQLFDIQLAPGNWGSVDLGSASNGTPDLVRQLQNGPNAGDFTILKNAGKLAADGTIQAPLSLGGDPGISSGTKSAWDAIVGKNKIIPLVDTVSGTGNNTVYHVVGFAGVRIIDANLTGNPKSITVQPTTFYSTHVTGSITQSGGMSGVLGPPKLVLP